MLKIHNCSDPLFNEYGTFLGSGYEDIVSYLIQNSPMPNETNLYERDDEKMHLLPSYDKICKSVYPNEKVEIGYCNGYNSHLNCLEYHDCKEVDVAASDIILLLAKQEDIDENDKLDSSKAKAFLLKKGEAVILNPYIFHYSPCKLSKDGFKCAIILTDGTNKDLDYKPEDIKLWKENKWLYAHKESAPAQAGAYIGITGENIVVPCN